MTALPERVMVVVGGNFDGRWVREEELLTAGAEQERFKVGMNVWKDAWNEKALQADALRAQLLDAERERDDAVDKALRFDLDRAGIEQREREAVELVALRAQVAALTAERDALAHAVLRYGWHDTDCPFLQDELPCTCDLEAIESTARAILGRVP